MYLSSSMDEDKCLQGLFVDPLCRKPADNLHPCFCHYQCIDDHPDDQQPKPG